MGGEELELFARAAAGARYSEPIKLEGLNQTDFREKFVSVITYSTGIFFLTGYITG